MLKWCLGVDSSNYTTSVAGCSEALVPISIRTPFDVRPGERGVRQNDAVFLHTKELPSLVERLMEQYDCPPSAVAVSTAPRDVPGSYMPCFLAGVSVARSTAALLQVPLYSLSHQKGHVLAALFGCSRLDLLERAHFAYHVSGGTTELLRVVPSADGDLTIHCVGEGADLHAGQLIDRCGVRMGLKFPCGQALEQLSKEGALPAPPMRFPETRSLNLSGVENKFVFLLKHHRREDMALWLLETLANALVALAKAGMRGREELPLVLAGGVSSNRLICARLAQHFTVCTTDHAFAADNACGVALYGALKMKERS
ncbi:MAG: peptidase M22 [Clostridia bacterium]|nr:peptidase M22 [Clostridia bacterium]